MLKIVSAIFLVALGLAAFETQQDEVHPNGCAKFDKVKAILSINYRDATILLENGDTVTVNQATLKPGDAFCIAY